ncbi:MAG: hypothetical protein ABIH80_01195 [Methanobacteriota archaeon]
MGKSLYEIHTSYVEELKKRGEKIVHCLTNEPAVAICVLGYDKTAGYKTAGYIYRNEDGPEGEFELLQDHLTGIRHVKWADIGLCDAKCWYEAIENNRVHEEKRSVCKSMNWKKAADCNNSECDDYQICAFEGQNYHFESKQTAALAELCINVGVGQAVVSPEGKIEFHDTGLNISLRDMQFVVQEAEAYIKYRKERGCPNRNSLKAKRPA